MKRLISIVLVLALCLFSVSALAESSFKDAKYGVVRIYGESRPRYTSGNYSDTQVFECNAYITWTGSAFAVGTPGQPVEYFVTNKHCTPSETETFPISLYNKTTGAYEGTIEAELPVESSMYIVFTTFGKKEPVNVYAVSDTTDLAILELFEPTTLRTPLVLRPFETDQLQQEQIYTVGFPGINDDVLNAATAESLVSTPDYCNFTSGITGKVVPRSRADADFGGEIISIDATINAGNSGGPLVDSNGYVLGVNTWGYDGYDVYWAVSVNEVVELLDQHEVTYTTVEQINKGGSIGMYIGIAAGVAVVVVLLVMLLGGRNRKTGFMLVGVVGDLRGKAFDLCATTTVGRDSKAQIRFPDVAKGVSNQHCIVNVKDGQTYVTDCSTHGTWIDSTRLEKGAPTPIKQGQTIFLGSAKQGLMLK